MVKRYRLLKPLPELGIGAEFKQAAPDTYYYGGHYSYSPMTVETLPDWFAPIDERWKPVNGEVFFSVNRIGSVISEYWTSSPIDNLGYDCGNVFKTRDQAQTAAYRIRELLMKIHEEEDNV